MAIRKISLADDFDKAVRETVNVLNDGGVAVFPTETVYGIGVAADLADALAKLRELKDRPAPKPFQMLAADLEMARKIGAVFSAHARGLALAYWPGPLTLVVPDGTGAGTLGIRVPDSPFTLALCQALGRPVIASSANRAGSPPPLDADSADVFGDGVDLLIDGGPVVEGVPSTIVECRDDGFTVLREGGISKQAIASAWMA